MKKILILPALALAFMLGGVASASASVVYNAVPDPLAPNYPSQPFQAQQTNEFGDYVHLAGTDRQLTTVVVTMSDWALAVTPANVTFCAASASNCDATGFFWPITVNIYSNSLTNDVPNTLLGTKTINTHIPWRSPEDPTNCPTKDSPGYAYKYQSTPGVPDTNCSNGYAFNATFDLSDLGLTLPNDVIVGFVYNTQTYGPSPTGVDGPYNSLNIAVPPSDPVTVGTDDSTDQTFWNTETVSYYTNIINCLGNTFCKDTNWSPYGTVAMQINAIAPAPTTVTVTVNKFVDGTQATAGSANSSSFPMLSTTLASNVNGGVVSGPNAYTLDVSDTYSATTTDMALGANYSTNEVTGGFVVGASCSDGKPYALVGYKSGDTLALAQLATQSPTASFTDLTSNKVVLVLNQVCVPTPVHVSPANGSTLTTATWLKADWNDVTDPVGGITYVYQSSNSPALNSDGSFITPVYTSGVLSVSEIPTPGTPAGVWYWHVKATDADGNVSAWSNAWSVTVDNTPPAVVVPTDKNQCMNNGWKTLKDAIDGKSFKNQGDCVSFVATKGKNKAAGSN